MKKMKWILAITAISLVIVSCKSGTEADRKSVV